MTNLFGKDTEAVLEKHVGKAGTRLLVVLGALAFAVGCLAISVEGVHSMFEALAPMVPEAASPTLTDWLFRAALIIIFGLIAWLVFRRFRSVESNTANRLEVVAQGVMEAILDKEIPAQKGDEGKPTAGPPPIQGTTEANLRVELAKKVLREGAEVARETGTGKIDYATRATAERAALHYVLLRMVRDLFSPKVIAEFEAERKAIEQKMKMRNQSPDGRSHFIEIADFYERLADKLEIDDLDHEAELPGSFAQYRKHNAWSAE